jgi:hypothetical protein
MAPGLMINAQNDPAQTIAFSQTLLRLGGLC